MTAMPNLPASLVEVGDSLERQFRERGLDCQKVGVAEWDVLSVPVRSLIPSWLVTLLANHALAGPMLERPHESGSWMRYFCFWTRQIMRSESHPMTRSSAGTTIGGSAKSLSVGDSFRFPMKAMGICGLSADLAGLPLRFTSIA